MEKEKIYTHTRAKKQNTSFVLKLICTKRANTRSNLARLTKLSKMTLSNIVAELIAEDYIIEIDRSVSRASKGRTPIVLKPSPNAPLSVGIFISRVDCQLVMSTIDAKIVKSESFAIQPDITKDMLLEKAYESYLNLVLGTDRKILGIGITSIGPIDKAHGVILNPPDFYGMENIAVKAFFEDKTGLPVYFDNNMNAAVLAEKLFGHGKELSDILYLGVTNGVGAGIISNGNLLDGSSGINGEIGHTTINFDGTLCQCGNRGCLEYYASIPHIVESALREMQEAGVAVNKNTYNWPCLVELAREGEYYSLRALNRLCEYLAVGIINTVNMLDCDEIFLGHDIALAEGLVERHLERLVNDRIFASNIKSLRVRVSAFGVQTPLIGSICLALNSLFGSSN
ncbi:MAG: ROK family protein [Oscillospiraceae bacterium]|nr:ROK family protein [Oscillospiraceae bacterium]